jgi:uroporphyrin-III C-methyltransferase/precorrin-2 dehydrogenase/sirohydrochlorin ferrochelatase
MGGAYPIQLVGLAGKKVLVAGGGSIAERKIEELLPTGAAIWVVAPELTESLRALLPRLARFFEREVRLEDLDGAVLAIAATDDRAINRALAEEAARRGIWVNAVDDPTACTFFAPAVVRRGPVTIAIGTDGKSPLLAAQLRRLLEAWLPRSLDRVGELLSAARERGKKGLAGRGALLRALADPHLSRWVEAGELERAAERLEAVVDREEEPFAPGSVAIVGAGPGSRELLTLRALDRIRRADVILHDALVEPEVLAEALPGTRTIEVGRRCGAGGVAAELIPALLVREARSNQRVVRLHAGDAFVFGRGAEEIDALARAGVPVELVPGLSAALAAPVAAGIPLTERGLARGITIRTGHTKEGWAGGAEIPTEEETLVILMGLGGVDKLLAGLIAEGRSPDTPAAAVASASRAGQRVVSGTLRTLASRIAASGIESPATIVVGAVARRADLALSKEAAA